LNGLEVQQIAVDNSGDLFLSTGKIIYRYGEGKTTLLGRLSGKSGDMSFYDDGMLYVSDTAGHKVVAFDDKGRSKDIVTNVDANFITISKKGIYFSETSKKRVGFHSFVKKDVRYFAVPGNPTGLAISAEQTFISVGIENSPFGYSFKLQADGGLSNGQEYVHYHLPYGASAPGVSAMMVDTANWLYSATALGIQMSDQLGRVNFIISSPEKNISDMKMAGPEFNWLYVTSGGKLFRRKTNTKGTESWRMPIKPSRPRL
jgi:sugar lactone lactonase YvrE